MRGNTRSQAADGRRRRAQRRSKLDSRTLWLLSAATPEAPGGEDVHVPEAPVQPECFVAREDARMTLWSCDLLGRWAPAVRATPGDAIELRNPYR